MKVHSTLFITSIVIFSFLLSTIEYTSATVGGETFIYDVKYNPSDESVYYTQIDLSGRGCPPELKKVSLTSEKTSVVFSCDEGEKLSGEQVNSQINSITKNFKALLPIGLKNNGIAADITFIKAETYDSESEDILLRHFVVDVYQNGKKIKEFPITGCALNQPFTIQGYSIPGFDKKILLLISAKNNCHEGGYIYESLQVLGGVDNLDKTITGNFYKNSSALLPNESNLVIYGPDKVTTSEATSTSTAVKPVRIINEAVTSECWWTKLINWLRHLL